jgi:hypothetical protein
MAQNQQLGTAGHIVPRDRGHGAEDLAGQPPVGKGDQHPAMPPATTSKTPFQQPDS